MDACCIEDVRIFVTRVNCKSNVMTPGFPANVISSDSGFCCKPKDNSDLDD